MSNLEYILVKQRLTWRYESSLFALAARASVNKHGIECLNQEVGSGSDLIEIPASKESYFVGLFRRVNCNPEYSALKRFSYVATAKLKRCVGYAKWKVRRFLIGTIGRYFWMRLHDRKTYVFERFDIMNSRIQMPAGDQLGLLCYKGIVEDWRDDEEYYGTERIAALFSMLVNGKVHLFESYHIDEYVCIGDMISSCKSKPYRYLFASDEYSAGIFELAKSPDYLIDINYHEICGFDGIYVPDTMCCASESPKKRFTRRIISVENRRHVDLKTDDLLMFRSDEGVFGMYEPLARRCVNCDKGLFDSDYWSQLDDFISGIKQKGIAELGGETIAPEGNHNFRHCDICSFWQEQRPKIKLFMLFRSCPVVDDNIISVCFSRCGYPRNEKNSNFLECLQNIYTGLPILFDSNH